MEEKDIIKREKARIRALRWAQKNKDVVNARRREDYKKYPEKYREWKRRWDEKNKEKMLASKADYCKRHRGKVYAYKKAWRDKNPEKCKEMNKRNKEKGGKKYVDRQVARHAERMNEDLSYKIKVNLRVRFATAVRRVSKGGSAVRALGCSIEELKIYLEKRFLPGMSWENWAVDGWHIDHINALANFDLTNPDQIAKACHYTNLQPLWAKENIIKSNKQ